MSQVELENSPAEVTADVPLPGTRGSSHSNGALQPDLCARVVREPRTKAARGRSCMGTGGLHPGPHLGIGACETNVTLILGPSAEFGARGGDSFRLRTLGGLHQLPQQFEGGSDWCRTRQRCGQSKSSEQPASVERHCLGPKCHIPGPLPKLHRKARVETFGRRQLVQRPRRYRDYVLCAPHNQSCSTNTRGGYSAGQQRSLRKVLDGKGALREQWAQAARVHHLGRCRLRAPALRTHPHRCGTVMNT